MQKQPQDIRATVLQQRDALRPATASTLPTTNSASSRCASLSASSARTTAIQRRYGQREQFLQKVNPDTQAYFAMKPEVAVTGDFPTLDELRDCYGEQFASAWLVPQIYDMSAFTGARNLTEKQQEQLADILAVECRSLKVTELMLFFYRFKTGRYGRFYGAVDPMVVTTALQDFLRERDELRDKCADEAAAKWDTEARSRWEQVLKAVAERLPRLQAGTDIYIFTTEPHSHRLLVSIGNSEAERYITAPQQWQVWEQIAAHYFPPDFGTLVLRRGYTPEASSTEPAHPPEAKK